MNANPAGSPLAAQRGNYVLLRAGTLRLLLPQGEVGAVEYLESAPDSESGQRSAGKIGRRLVALSQQMRLLPRCPADRFLVTALGAEDDDLGWCWNEVRVLIDIELSPQLLPTVLRAPYTPVDQYVEYEDEIAYLCTAGRLSEFALAGVE
jgi:hypothetical protein